MLLTLSVSSSGFISYFLPITTYFHCVLEAILVTICTIQFYSSAKGFICLHFSLLVLSHTEIKPNKTLAPVHAPLHEKLHPRLTFQPGLKSTPFRTTRPRITDMQQLNLLLQEQWRIQGRGPGDPIHFSLPYFGLKKKRKKEKKESQREENPAVQATENLPLSSFLSARFGSATEDSITFKYFPGFCFGKFLRNRW